MIVFRAILSVIRILFVFSRAGLVRQFMPEDAPLALRILSKLAGFIEKRSDSDNIRDQGLREALEKLGPSYIKLGQFLAIRPDIVGKDLASELSKLQDQAKPFPDSIARDIITKNLGQNIDQVFLDFSNAVAAASIAQVHKARIIDEKGERNVAIKILRPDIAKKFAKDLQTFFFIARTAEKFIPKTRRLRPVEAIRVLERSAFMEVDLRMEAAAISETAENFIKDDSFRVPDIEWQYTFKNMLTMEWIDGIKISDRESLLASGHDVEKLGQGVLRIFLLQALRDGFFHADMHPGNVLVDSDGRIVGIDFGIVGRIGKKEQRFLAEILYGFIKRNYYKIAEVHFEAGYVPNHHTIHDFAQALRSIGEPIYGLNASEISMAHLLTQLFEITDLFDMQMRPELLMLEKAMVVSEGVGRFLDPDLNIWDVTEPVVTQWLKTHLGPSGKIAELNEILSAVKKLVHHIPVLVDEIEERKQSKLSSVTGMFIWPFLYIIGIGMFLYLIF